MFRYIAAIASAHNKKKKIQKKKISQVTHPIHTCSKEQHLKWLEQGKCQCCGAESGKHEGICDQCLL